MHFIVVTLFYLLVGFLTASFGLLFSFLLYLYYIHKIYEHFPGPPRSSFIFGNVPEIAQYRKDGGTLGKYLVEKRLQHGAIFVVFYMHRAVIIISNPVYLREILNDFNKYGSKSKFHQDKMGYVFGQRIVGNCILNNLDNESWRKRRHIMDPAFHRKCLKNFITDFNEVCDRFLIRMMNVVEEQQEVSMLKEFSKVTLDIISKVAFNIKIGAIEDPDCPFARVVCSVLKGIEDGFNMPFNAAFLSIFQFSLLQSASQKEQINAAKFLRKFAFECITNRINDIKANKDVPNDLLSMLVNDKSLSMDDIIDEFILIFVAGNDTTTNSLAFTLYEIAQNPDIEAKILNELSNVLGSKENVDYDDLAKLKYLGQVLQESLRKYPIGRNGPMRILKKEITVGGYRIPNKSAVSLEKYVFHHDPEIWTNPEIFDPERFSETIPNLNMFYFPFSIGPRNCIGQHFSRFESKIILAKIIGKFRFELLPGQTGAIDGFKLFLTPRDGVMCKVQMR